MDAHPEAAPDEGVSDLDPRRIAEARRVIDPIFLDTPQYRDPMLDSHLGHALLVKVETLNPLRSFKGRGAETFMARVPTGSTLVCASGGGNFGQAIAYAAQRRGFPSVVFVPQSMSEVKVERARALGATVHRTGGDHQEEARGFAAQDDSRILAEDGRQPAIAEGAGTIGAELLATGGFDTLVLPMGDGALITGVARWTKEYAPHVRIVAATAADAPALAHAWRTGRNERIEPSSDFAAGISVAQAHPESVRWLQALVDDVLAVDQEHLVAAMNLAADTLGVLPEPAGAAGLATIMAHDVVGPVATVITGANSDPASSRTTP